MAEVNNTFVRGVMNKDLDERLIDSQEYRDALNITVATTPSSNMGSAHNSLGNELMVSLAELSGATVSNARTIGCVTYEKDNLVYWFVASDNFDGIYEYSEFSKVSRIVLQCSKSGGNPSVLNFSQKSLITGVNYINGFLYWTDNLNPPRKINIARAKTYSVDDSRIPEDINVIFAPPLTAPTLKLLTDGTEANNVEEKFVTFSYRYKNIDGQYSAISPFSGYAFLPKDFYIDYITGVNTSMVNNINAAEISVDTGGQFVTDIQVLMHDTRSSNVYIVDTFNKSKLGLANNDLYKFNFSNNKVYSVLLPEQVTRLFDNVPLKAKAQDFVGSRLMYGNYTQFYDIKDVDNNDIKIDLKLANSYKALPDTAPRSTFRSDRDYEVAIEYLDGYGRSTTALTSVGNTTYIPPSQSITANFLDVSIKNKPPFWADRYRLLIKQSKGKYYNVFPLTFVKDGAYRWFLINESDRDKVVVGKYVIFKSGTSGATLTNTKYKVLDLKAQDKDFVSGASDGLYFKVKAKDNYDLNPNLVFSLSTNSIFTYINKNSNQLFNSFPMSPLKTFGYGYCETPIYYGKGNKNGLKLVNNNYGFPNSDARITIKITSKTTFDYTMDYTAVGGWVKNNTISTSNTPIQGTVNGQTYTYVTIKFDSNYSPVIGDVWKINCRSVMNGSTYNIFGGIKHTYAAKVNYGGTVIVPKVKPSVGLKKIYPGAIIKIKILQDTTNGGQYYDEQKWVSNDYYENIEEWFIESEAYKTFKSQDGGTNIGAKSVYFSRLSSTNTSISAEGFFDYGIATGSVQSLMSSPMYMFIEGRGTSKKGNTFEVSFSITQTDSLLACETEGIAIDSDIYHETTKTLPIVNGVHLAQWSYANYSSYTGGKTVLGLVGGKGGTITANSQKHFFSVGDKVYVRAQNITAGYYNVLYVLDAYNIVIDLAYPGAGTVPGKVGFTDFDLDQTSTGAACQVRLNNLYSVNKDYNAWCFGNGIESMVIKDDWNYPTIDYSLRVNSFVEDYKQKVSENAICYSGLYQANTSLDRLNEFNLSIANFKYLDKKFGSIQKLFARDTDLVVLQDDKVSKVLYGKNLLIDAVGGGQVASIPEVLGTQVAFYGEYGISRNPESFASFGPQIFFTDARRGTPLTLIGDQISEINNGMNYYFKDLFRDNFNTQKLGAFDPYSKMYVLSSNSTSTIPCSLSVNKKYIYMPFYGGINRDIFITADIEYSISAVNMGYDIGWVKYSKVGFGNANLKITVASNMTGAYREVKLVISYCNGLTEDIIIRQQKRDSIESSEYINFVNLVGKYA